MTTANNTTNVVKVIIEQTENNYGAYIEGIDGIVTVGNNIDEIKTNIVEAIELFIETSKEFGDEIPVELKGNYELVFKMDVQSMLNVYSKIFTKAGLERLTGINQKLLWHYATGSKKPRAEQAMKLEHALHKLGAELLAINL